MTYIILKFFHISILIFIFQKSLFFQKLCTIRNKPLLLNTILSLIINYFSVKSKTNIIYSNLSPSLIINTIKMPLLNLFSIPPKSILIIILLFIFNFIKIIQLINLSPKFNNFSKSNQMFIYM